MPNFRPFCIRFSFNLRSGSARPSVFPAVPAFWGFFGARLRRVRPPLRAGIHFPCAFPISLALFPLKTDTPAAACPIREKYMKRLAIAAVLSLCTLALNSVSLRAQTQNSPPAPAPAPVATQGSAQSSTQQTPQIVTQFTLPPDRYKKAHDLGRIHFRFNIISFVYGLVILCLVLQWRLAPKYRDWAESASPHRILQAIIFAPLLILTLDVLGLPPEIYDNWVSRKYGLSVQGWGSWTWDWTKGEIISLIGGTILIWILYAVIRKSPRRWWFYFWVVSLPIIVFVTFLQPLVVDPLFHKFEPLASKDPALTASLEEMVQRTGKHIPPERMFWMGAAEKSTELDAYVTGVGSSKRIVVWDTTIAKMTTPQITFVVGHEMGHYVLNHIPKGIAFYSVFLLLIFYLGYRCMHWMLGKWGMKWAIRGVDDWASLPALMLLLTIFSFVANPITSAFSRHIEHQADQYGLEITHGLTPDSAQVAAQAFEVLGNVDLSDPEPSPADVFLFYSHPTISDRIRFALTYDPWAAGGHGEFVP
jgi:STE24 endopeptidase